MRALALLLAIGTPAIAAERLPTPRAATTAQLKAAVARILARLLTAKTRQNRFKDAAHYLRTALRAFDATAGAQSAGSARAALLLAITVSMTGEEDPAPLVVRAIPAIRAALAPTHTERIEAEFILALMVYNVERDIPAALRQIRLVTDASLKRARSIPDFGVEAKREMQQLAPAFAIHVRPAWKASQLPRR